MEAVLATEILLPLDREGIMGIIPHRPPFLLVDRILELDPGKKAKGEYFADPKSDYFKGHFPGNPVMPGVLILEAMNQVGVVALLASPEYQGKITVFHEVLTAKFKRPVKPGDNLVIDVNKTQENAWQGWTFGECEGVVRVNSKVVASATVKFAIMDSL